METPTNTTKTDRSWIADTTSVLSSNRQWSYKNKSSSNSYKWRSKERSSTTSSKTNSWSKARQGQQRCQEELLRSQLVQIAMCTSRADRTLLQVETPNWEEILSSSTNLRTRWALSTTKVSRPTTKHLSPTSKTKWWELRTRPSKNRV